MEDTAVTEHKVWTWCSGAPCGQRRWFNKIGEDFICPICGNKMELKTGATKTAQFQKTGIVL
jgi:hypothetical protein